jgi:hypothetical protein
MRSRLFLILILTTTQLLLAQTNKPDLGNLTAWQVVNRKVEQIDEAGKKGVRLNEASGDGLLILKGSGFSGGTIEFDVKGKNVLQQSFVGFAFHIQNETTYDAVYFRPFNFMNADTARRSRAVQYVFHPEYTWDKLRAVSPGKYENKVNPVPDPDGWFHVKIVVEGNKVKAFVNNSTKPSLEVEKICKFNNGQFGFWVGNNSSGSFSNLVITPSKK